MRLVLLALAALLLPAQARPPARDIGRVALAPDAEARWVPFELTPGNQVAFAVTIDGAPATAVLDTGVSHSVLSDRWAGLDRTRVKPNGKADAIGGTVAVGWTPTRTLGFGGLTRTGGGLIVARLPSSTTGGKTGVDVLVGRDLLAAHALDIDYPAKRFRLIPSGRLPFPGATAPLVVSPTRRVYEGEFMLGGRRVRPVIVDTGDGSAVTVTTPEWRAAALKGVPTTTAVAFGLAGPQVSGLAIAPELKLGEVAARDVEIRIEEPGGFSEKIGVAGRIGSGLLGRYRVLLDPGAGRMVLSPGPAADAPAIRSTSGLLLGVLPDRLRVLHVMRGGPGAAAGWRADETICRVDGEPITPAYPASALARWTVGEPGRVVRLTTCAGADKPVTLRRFY